VTALIESHRCQDVMTGNLDAVQIHRENIYLVERALHELA
jgi:hypothetical protein